MRIGSLFSGIGGLELGLEWAGVGHTVWQCEVNPWCRGILASHWPDVRRFEDIKTMGIEDEIPAVDLICGGFPCQDISAAGHRAGLEGERSGLFYELIRILRVVRPRWVVLENVANILAMPEVLGPVLSELHQSGYDGEWSVISAADVGAPHLRRRWFFIGWRVADSDGARLREERGRSGLEQLHALGRGLTLQARPQTFPPRPGDLRAWERLPVDDQPAICRSVDGVSEWLGDIDEVEALKGLGNAVVPQVAQVVGRRLMELKAEVCV